MAARRPLVVLSGQVAEIPVGDTLATDLVPAGSTQIWTGGGAATVFTDNTPRLVCGGAS